MPALLNFLSYVFNYLTQSGLLLVAPSFVSTLFSGITYFLPKQSDFQADHEELTKSLLKKRSEAVVKFVASVEFVPESIMDVKDVESEELVLTLDKYTDYKYEIAELKGRYYRKEATLRNLFFISMALVILGLLHPYAGVVAFFIGIVVLICIFFNVVALSQITKRIHTIKTCPDFVE